MKNGPVKNFLIVHESAIISKGLKQTLCEEFPLARITEIDSVKNLRKKIHVSDLPLVFMDVAIGDNLVFDFVKELRIDFPQLKILILSVHPEQWYGIRALRAGASGYLSVQTNASEIISATRRVLGGKKYISDVLAELLASNLSEGKLPHELLSDREFEVLKQIASGKTVEEISESLSLGTSTVNTYRARTLEKMNFRSNSDLIRYTLENKLI